MDNVKRVLVEAGVIGCIIDNFNPHIYFNVFFRDKQVTLGHQISFADVRECPDRVAFHFDAARPDIIESFMKPTLITLIMTDVDDARGEYLHWLATDIVTLDYHKEPCIRECQVVYEPPRSMGSRMIVVTLFKPNKHPNFMINSRENFSTRGFAIVNALGPPLSATYFIVNNENGEEQNTRSDVDDLRICSTRRTSSKRKEEDDESSSQRKKFKKI